VIRKNRFSLGQPADLVTGRIEIKRSGDGYLADLEGPLNIRVSQGNLGTALPGDLVVVRLDPSREVTPPPIRNGKVIRILERAKRLIVGTLQSTGKFHYVVPLDPTYQQDFYVPAMPQARINDRVVVQFNRWDNRHINPEGEIIEVLGPADNPSLDTRAVIRHYGLAEDFPRDALEEAAAALGRMDQLGRRLDLRGRFIFTVDPTTARDFDDALSLEADSNGRRVLGIHIADVSHFVLAGSALDREAAQRGNSVYLPDRVLPMLPEQLSNGICSLKPDQDRLTFSIFITFDDHARPLATHCKRSLIRSSLRLTYEQAFAIIQCRRGMRCAEAGVDAATVELVQRINELAQQLRQQRFAQHALDLDISDFEIIVGRDGMIEDVRRVANDLSHQMIEECMIAANEAVDRELERHNRSSIHRLHEPPDDEKIFELIAVLKGMGYRPGDLRQRRQLSDFVRSVKGTPLGVDAQLAVLRSMKRAIYSVPLGGHFGLAKKHYTHFTSPIRRYPDLVIHRLLQAALENWSMPYRDEQLQKIALHCTTTEQIAEQAERDILEIKKYRFLAQQLETPQPQVFDAVVVKTTNFGMFVELLQLEVQGLVHISAISDRFVRYDVASQSLRAGPRIYHVGTRLRVIVSKVNFDQRRIDFALHDAPATRSRRA
jgi:ribonuclease R